MTEHKTKQVILRVTPDHKQIFEGAADNAGLSLSEWIRAVLLRAANEGAFAPKKGRQNGKKK